MQPQDTKKSKKKSDLFAERITSDSDVLSATKDHLNQELVSWSDDMKGDAEQCVQRYREPANKGVTHLERMATRCVDDHLVEIVREVAEICAQMLFFVCIFPESDDPIYCGLSTC